jgi:hypothetical protein
MQTAFYDARVIVFPSESATSLLHFRRQLSLKVVNIDQIFSERVCILLV